MFSYPKNKNIIQTIDSYCPTVGYQRVNVCVPVEVTPYANAGSTTTYCCGNPIITSGSTPCEGIPNGSCTFTISQQLCVAVPVKFGASADVGAPHVLCGGASGTDNCSNCNQNGGIS